MLKITRHNENDPRLSEDGWTRKFFLLPRFVHVITPLTTVGYMAWLEVLEYKDSGSGVEWRFNKERNTDG